MGTVMGTFIGDFMGLTGIQGNTNIVITGALRGYLDVMGRVDL